MHDLITTTGGPVPLRTVRTELTAAGHRTEIVSRSLTRAFAFERLTLGFTPHFVRVVARGPAAEVT